MRKILFAVAVLALLAPMAAQAQSTVGVSATIANSASWVKAQDLQFGTVPAAGKDIATTDAVNSGRNTLTYNYGLTITFSNLTTLSGDTGGSLAVTVNCALDSGAGFGAETACASTSYPLAAPTTSKTALLAVGGSISAAAAAGAAAGYYTGTLNLIVTP